MNWYMMALKEYATFKGRAQRSEYWYFILINNIAIGILSIMGESNGGVLIEALLGLIALAIFIPTIAVTVRRLHDVGKSGWWMFILLVPFLGWCVLLYFLLTKSHNVDKSAWWILIGLILSMGVLGLFVLLYFLIQDSKNDNEYGINPKSVPVENSSSTENKTEIQEEKRVENTKTKEGNSKMKYVVEIAVIAFIVLFMRLTIIDGGFLFGFKKEVGIEAPIQTVQYESNQKSMFRGMEEGLVLVQVASAYNLILVGKIHSEWTFFESIK